MTNLKTATPTYSITRAWLISELRAVAIEAKKHGDLAAADEALELAWRIAMAVSENRTLQ